MRPCILVSQTSFVRSALADRGFKIESKLVLNHGHPLRQKPFVPDLGSPEAESVYRNFAVHLVPFSFVLILSHDSDHPLKIQGFYIGGREIPAQEI